ncbi:MAG TPA: LemA family protein, partial [Blastocatellia bacterium]|nr:LemA family protein [Blastocatellia bacterium]
PIAALPDTHQDLKANDAYLRLSDELKKAEENVKKAREDYLKSVAAYNDVLQRNPYALGAYGMGFLKMEPVIEAE